MDTSSADDQTVKLTYAEAQDLRLKYKVSAYPTFLFFTPEGRILKQSVGQASVDDFLKLAAGAIDPKANYYQLLADYQHGKKDLTVMSYLATTSLLQFKDTALSKSIAKDYLLHLHKGDWLKKENIQFLTTFTRTTKDPGFTFFYRNTDAINKIMEYNDYAQDLVQGIIYREDISPILKKLQVGKTSPNWSIPAKNIEKHYGKYYADRVLTGARISWCIKTKAWPVYTKYLVIYVDKYLKNVLRTDPISILLLNNDAWAVFKYSNNRQELLSALDWSNKVIRLDPQSNWMDTYANLLYKLGQDKLAISWESVAIKNDPNDKGLWDSLTKMKAGQPTWREIKN